MVNTKEFSERLQKVMEYKQLSASSFADSISVQRSSISHILSGRNKPSLDFVMKVVETYKEIDLQWLLYGKGRLLKTGVNKPEHAAADPPLKTTSIQKQRFEKTIEKIMVFYSDGTFDEIKNL